MKLKKTKFFESLDIFLNLILNPLFSLQSTEKEIYSINSEYEKNYHIEEKKFERLFQQIANPLHDFSKFSTGNLYTLNKTNTTHLHSELVHYYKSNYLTSNMKLLIYSNFETELIENYLIKEFSTIQNDEKIIEKRVEKSKNIHVFENMPKLIFYKSRFKTLKIFFQLTNSIKQEFMYNPKKIMKLLLNPKKNNLLKEKLMERRLIFNYSLEFKEKSSYFSTVSFKFILTQKGMKNQDIIIKELKQFIDSLHFHIFRKDYYDSILSQIHKKNHPTFSLNNIKSMRKAVTNFNIYGKDNLFYNNYVIEFSPELLHKYIKDLSFQNSLIFIGSRNFKNLNDSYFFNVVNNFQTINPFNFTNFLNKTEPWYKIKYTEILLEKDQIWHLTHNQTSNHYEFKNLSRRTKKKSVNICKGKSQKKCKAKLQKATLNLPQLVYNKNNTDIYFLQDKSHLQLSFKINIKLFMKLDLQNKINVPIMKLFIIFLNFGWNELIKKNNYQNNDVDLIFLDNPWKYKINFEQQSTKEMLTSDDFELGNIFIKINAKSQKEFSKLDFKLLLNSLKSYHLSSNDFLFLKEELLRNVEYYRTSNPTHQAYNWLYRLGYKIDFDFFNMTSLIQNITFPNFNIFKENAFKLISRKIVLVFGNINKADSIHNSLQIIENIVDKNKLKTKTTLKQKFLNLTKIILTQNKTYLFPHQNLFNNSKDSSTLNVYFVGNNNLKNSIMIQILSSISKNLVFSKLRTESQLGYLVKNKVLEIGKYFAYSIFVQGSKESTGNVEKKIDNIIELVKDTMKSIPIDTFNEIKDKVMQFFIKKYLKFNEKNDMFFSFLIRFGPIIHKLKIIKIISNLKLTHFLEFIDQIYKRKLSIQITDVMKNFISTNSTNSKIGNNKKDQPSIQIILDSVDYFRKLK